MLRLLFTVSYRKNGGAGSITCCPQYFFWVNQLLPLPLVPIVMQIVTLLLLSRCLVFYGICWLDICIYFQICYNFVFFCIICLILLFICYFYSSREEEYMRSV